ncbi:MAG TPA: hypothetical protein VMW75_09660 [Thermoanaerobaculia bacterium]|nr:hypothetical protein [Thermoanaerobaculia bacterium]
MTSDPFNAGLEAFAAADDAASGSRPKWEMEAFDLLGLTEALRPTSRFTRFP